jgi:hypothetical protein
MPIFTQWLESMIYSVTLHNDTGLLHFSLQLTSILTSQTRGFDVRSSAVNFARHTARPAL